MSDIERTRERVVKGFLADAGIIRWPCRESRATVVAGGGSRYEWCMRDHRHMQLARTATAAGSDPRPFDHYCLETGRWWDLDGFDRTGEHEAAPAAAPADLWKGWQEGWPTCCQVAGCRGRVAHWYGKAYICEACYVLCEDLSARYNPQEGTPA